LNYFETVANALSCDKWKEYYHLAGVGLDYCSESGRRVFTFNLWWF